MIQTREGLEQYAAQFDALKKQQSEPHWLRTLREAAFAEFLQKGFPTTRDEDWQFTNIAPITRRRFHTPSFERILGDELEPFLLPGEIHRMVFLNGNFSSELSTMENSRIQIGPLNEALVDGMPEIESHLSHHAKSESNALVALNTAFFQDGALIVVPERTTISKPLQILHVALHDDVMISPRNLIVIGDQSEISILESYVSLNGSSYFTNAVTEMFIGQNAICEHSKIQKESENAFHISSTNVEQKRDGSYSSYNITIGAAIARNEVDVALNGEGSNSVLNGLYLSAGQQHVDNHTAIDHCRPNATSQELYKGILDGKSKAVFNGKIVVRKEAQLTNARQTNKNLLISDGAQVSTKPELQILADDVKCSHGATIGQLDPEAIFYFESRGMNAEIAKSLLTFGFAAEVVETIKSQPVREHLTEWIRRTLGRGNHESIH